MESKGWELKKKKKRKKGIKKKERRKRQKPRGTDINFGKVAPKTLMPVFNTSQNLLTLFKTHFPSKQHQTQESIQLKKNTSVTMVLLSQISGQNPPRLQESCPYVCLNKTIAYPTSTSELK